MLTCSHCGIPFGVNDAECSSCGKSFTSYGFLDNPRRTIGVWLFSVYLIGSGMTSFALVPYFALLQFASSEPELAQFAGILSRELAIALLVAGILELAAGFLLFTLKKAAIPFMLLALIAGFFAAIPIINHIGTSGPLMTITVGFVFSVAVQIVALWYARRLAAEGILGWTPNRITSKGFSY